ncbi:MAG: hypothetical protein TR69_WS6001000070 [candidate division WS6 bacterium OLB20]|uniref:Uncharacterized protein n=1 Tax=candidate division WS6 bacterium OLB20 TaxID=1617426 RepID=A0A136M177_9BACT|nr:MAG: hypothetical protein TR69_WS6001000070 [candidate division WS6 bacterium OLB20]
MSKLTSPVLPFFLFAALFGFTFLGLTLWDQTSAQSGPVRVKITPVVSFSEDISDCLKPGSLRALITDPAQDTTLPQNSITVTGAVENDCAPLFADKEHSTTVQWFVDGNLQDESSFSLNLDDLPREIIRSGC